MIRYTTETLVFTLPFEASSVEEAYITLSQADTRIERCIEEMAKSGNDLKARLTQEETAMFKAKKPCRIQLRVRDTGGNAYASQIYKVEVYDVMKEGVI